MADRPKKGSSRSKTPKAETSSDESSRDDLFDEVLDDLLDVFGKECGKPLSRSAIARFGALLQKTVGAAIDKGHIKEWKDEQKTYVYPHVRGIAARICGDCDADEITPEMLVDAADPWIKDARKRAQSALARLAARRDVAIDSDELSDVRLFLTVYCDAYS